MNGEEFMKRLEEITKDSNIEVEVEKVPCMCDSPVEMLHNLIFEAGIFEAVKRMLRSENYVTVEDIRVVLDIKKPEKPEVKVVLDGDTVGEAANE